MRPKTFIDMNDLITATKSMILSYPITSTNLLCWVVLWLWNEVLFDTFGKKNKSPTKQLAERVSSDICFWDFWDIHRHLFQTSDFIAKVSNNFFYLNKLTLVGSSHSSALITVHIYSMTSIKNWGISQNYLNWTFCFRLLWPHHKMSLIGVFLLPSSTSMWELKAKPQTG